MPVDPSSAYSMLNKTLGAANPYKPAMLMVCKIVMVNPADMSVDIFVPEVGLQYRRVPVAFASKGSDYGAVAMPAKNASGLVCFQDTSRPPVLIGCLGISTDTSAIQGWQQELVYEGETLLNGIGGSYLKLDKGGQAVFGAEASNFLAADPAGRNLSQSLGLETRTLGTTALSGLSLPKLIDYSTYPQLKNSQLRLLDRQEFLSGLNNFPVRTKEDLISPSNGFINYTLRDMVLAEVSQTIALVRGTDTTPGFAGTIAAFAQSFRSNISNGEFETKLAEVQNFINQYLLAEKGVRIIFEKGHATDTALKTTSDVLKLEPADFVQSSQGNLVCLRLRLQDVATQAEKALITVDTDGNCLVRMKSLKFEVEKYSVVEVS